MDGHHPGCAELAGLSADRHHGKMVDLADQRQPEDLSQPLAKRLLLVPPVAVVQHDGCARAQLVAQGWQGGVARELVHATRRPVNQEKIDLLDIGDGGGRVPRLFAPGDLDGLHRGVSYLYAAQPRAAAAQ